jgi:acyl-CoA synthetase (AMP-forming)/AMP-acid ligase II
MNVKSADALLEQEFGLIADLVRAYAHERPRHPALLDARQSIDFGSLDQSMDRVATALQRDKVQSGDAIAICAASCVEYGVVFLGALRAGVAVAPLAPSSTAEALVTMLADSGCQDLVFG